MQEYDLYINRQEPMTALYLPKGASLPDLPDPERWAFNGVVGEGNLPTDLVQIIETKGHAFWVLGD